MNYFLASIEHTGGDNKPVLLRFNEEFVSPTDALDCYAQRMRLVFRTHPETFECSKGIASVKVDFLELNGRPDHLHLNEHLKVARFELAQEFDLKLKKVENTKK